MAPTSGYPSKLSPGLWISGITGLDEIDTLKITDIVVRVNKLLSRCISTD